MIVWSKARAWTVVLAIAATIMMAACSGNTSPAHANTTVTNPEQPELFSIPQEQMAHIKVVTVEPVTLKRMLRLTGTVAYDADRTTPVITQVSGPVSRLVVSPGDKVRKGQPLLYITSPDYSQMRANYMKAKSAYVLAQKNNERTKDLFQHHAAAARDVEQAESAEAQAQADLAAAEASLRVLGITDPDSLSNSAPSAEVPVLAPISGEVVERLVSPGQLLAAGQTQCFTISDMHSVWVLVNVYQNDLAYVRKGDWVTIQTDSYPDVFRGRISYVAAALDPGTRTLQARIVTANPQEKLKKDMYVSASVEAGAVKNALAVPDAAVLRDTENQPFVYTEVGQNQFGKRTVSVGESRGGQTQIVRGLAAGDHVVGDGSLFLQFANSLQR